MVSKMKCFFSCCAMCCLLVATPTYASGGIPTLDAATMSAVGDVAERVVDVKTEVVNQLELARQMAAQLQTLKNINDYNAMQGVSVGGQQVMQDINATYGLNGGEARSYEEQLGTTTNVVKAVNAVNNEQMGNLGAEAQRIYGLANQSQNADGTLKAQQAGNQINVELTQQIQRMRTQLYGQALVQSTAVMQQKAKDESSRKLTEMFTGRRSGGSAPAPAGE